jgi:ribonuclease-3
MSNLRRLQGQLGYQFSDPDLLTLALTHRSVARRNNERLEFLGDSIVNHVIAESLYQQFPQAREGEMSRLRASLVKGETLAEVARDLNIGEHLILGSGERKSGGHRRSSILADTLEAISGAILLDSDYETCKQAILPWFAQRLAALSTDDESKDAKTRLQEFLQGRGLALPSYELKGVSGEDHQQIITVICKVSKPALSCDGVAGSRRKAEQAAAESVLMNLMNND